MKLDLKLYLITDRALSAKIGLTIFEVAEQACSAGINVLQYREKEFSAEKQVVEAARLRKIAGKRKVLFIVNDNPLIAKAVNADGVHVGREDARIQQAREILGENKIIGATARNADEAVEAEKNGADYVAISPIFATATKTDAGKPCGTRMISRVKKAVGIPVVAIGGINAENLARVFEAGADGAAMVSEFVKTKNVARTVGKLKETARKTRRKSKSRTTARV